MVFVQGDEVRKSITKKNDFAQAGERYLSLNTIDHDHLVLIIVESLSYALKPIQEKMLVNLMKANKELGTRIAKGLKL